MHILIINHIHHILNKLGKYNVDVDKICKSEQTNSDLAFIGLVDQDNEGDRRMALNAGAKDTVATPPTAEALAAVVERTLAEIRTERERDQFQGGCPWEQQRGLREQ